MVDNTIALQVRPFQMPDVGQIYGQAQTLQMNRMRMAEAQETAQERNALRGLLSSGVDINTPEGMAQLRRAAPMLAPQFEQAASQRAYQRAQIDRITSQNDREALQTAQTFLTQVRTPEQWAAIRPSLVTRFPQYAHLFRPEYSPELIRDLALGAESLRTQYFSRDDGIIGVQGGQGRVVPGTTPTPRPEFVIIEGAPFARVREGDNYRLRPVLEGEPPAPAPTTPPVTAPAAPPPAAAPAAERVPTSQSTDPLAIDSSIRRAEGTGQNPRSSARGPYQFVDRTFVQEFRRAFPDAAQGRSDADVLRFRGARLADGRQVEDVLGPAFTQQNVQALSRANIEPSGTNVYLAHHFGADGAIRMLNADRGTPIDRLVSRQVMDANPFLRGLTVNQVLSWAGNAMDYGPGEARRLLDASRAPAVEPGQTPAAAAPAAAATPAVVPATRANAMVTPAAGPASANAFVAASAPPPPAPARMFPQTPAEARAQRLEQEEDLAFRRERGQLRARSAADARSDLTTTTEALSIIGSITASRPDMPEGRSLLQTATGSFFGAGRDLATRATGIGETYNNIAASELETLQASLVSLLPRMRGDLNKAEFESLQAQAAKIGDRTQTYESRLAAVNALRDRLVRVQQRLARETGTELPPTLETLRPGPAPAPARGTNPRGEPPPPSQPPSQRLRFNPQTNELETVE
jgi:hypothetical protein